VKKRTKLYKLFGEIPNHHNNSITTRTRILIIFSAYNPEAITCQINLECRIYLVVARSLMGGLY
jgi:hypothetical protein